MLGLCFPDPAQIAQQIGYPVGSPPWHFVATSSTMEFGPYQFPPWTNYFYTTFDVVCVDVTGGVVGPYSRVGRVSIYN